MSAYPWHEPPDPITDAELDEWVAEAQAQADLDAKREREERDDERP